MNRGKKIHVYLFAYINLYIPTNLHTFSSFKYVDADDIDDLFDIDDEESDFKDISCKSWLNCRFSSECIGIEALLFVDVSQQLFNKSSWLGVEAEAIRPTLEDEESTLPRWAQQMSDYRVIAKSWYDIFSKVISQT